MRIMFAKRLQSSLLVLPISENILRCYIYITPVEGVGFIFYCEPNSFAHILICNIEYNNKSIMGDYNRNDRNDRGRGGGRGFGGGSRGGGGGGFRGRDSGRREMHKAVCDECGKDCQVPFRPSGDKPIFCSDCFERKDGGAPRRPTRRGGGGSGSFDKGDNTNKQLLEQMTSLNSKLDRILKVLESGVEKKPVSKKVVVEKEAKKVVKKADAKKEKPKTKKVSKKETEKSVSK